MSLLKDKVIAITGATSGIGLEAAKTFAAKGAKLALISRNEVEGAKLASELPAGNDSVIFIKADVAKESEVKQAFDGVVERFGKLDAAFNNAGIAEMPGPMSDLAEEDWDQVINVNLKGTWLCMKYQLPIMASQGSGSIVNMSSVYGRVGSGMGVSAYVASKHGVVGLTKAAALENAAAGIRVNAICPGWVETPANAMALSQPEIRSLAESLHPVGRLCEKNEVVAGVEWLISDASSFYTGQEMVIDGGLTAQ